MLDKATRVAHLAFLAAAKEQQEDAARGTISVGAQAGR